MPTGTKFVNIKPAAGGTGITSINGDVAAVQTISGASGKITITDVTPDHEINVGADIVDITKTNVFGDFDQDFRSNRLRIANPANSAHYSFTAAAIAADRVITLPLLVGPDTMVTEAFTQTLTNKTIDADLNTITNLAIGAEVTGASTDLTDTASIVLLTSVQILTNKTLDDFTNVVHADTVHFQVRNNTGSTLSKGDVVYVNGFDVPEDLPTVALADASAASTMPAIGVVTDDILTATNGDITSLGKIVDIDTTGIPAGSQIYVSETPGAFTQTKPTGTALIQNIGVVLKTGGAGVGEIKVVSVDRTNDLPNIPDGDIWIGDASGVPQPITMGGDATIDNAGLVTVTLASTDLTDTGVIVRTNQLNDFGDFDQTFLDNRLLIERPAGGNINYTFQAAAIAASRVITLPLLTGPDTMVTEAFAQTLTNKTMTAAANTFSGFAIGSEVSGASTDLTDTGIIVRTNQLNDFGDFDQTFLDNRLLIERPAGGNVNYTFIAAAIAANRSITLPLLAGNDTMVTEAFAQTLTNKTIDGDLNTILDIDETMQNVSTGGAGTVLTSNGVGVAPSYQTPGGGEFTGAWTADHNQGGTGFSLRDPRFSDVTDSTKEVFLDISGNTTAIVLTIATLQTTAQTLQIPNTTGTDQFVLEDFAQTLTNKTITAAANTLTIASTDLTDTASICLIAATQNISNKTFLGASPNEFEDNALIIQNPANNANYIFQSAAIAADRTVTLPLLTGPDTLVTEAFTQTLTNKTIDLDSNTITGTVAEFNAALQSETFAYIGVANAWGTVNQNIATTGAWQEGGVGISPIGRHDIPISAGAAEPTTTAGAGAKATREIGSGGNQKMVTYIPYTNNVDTNATFQIIGLPRNYNNSSFEVVFVWTSAVAPGAADTVRWVAKAVSLSSGDLISTAYGTEAGTDHTPGAETIDDVYISAAVTITPGNTPGDGDVMYLNVEREGLNAADDFAQIVQLLGIIIRPVSDAAVAA